MPEFRINFPHDGLDENRAFVKQPPTSTSVAVNMRGIDPKTGRIRGAQRSGLSKFASSQVGTSMIRRLESITIQDKLTTYAHQAPAVEWETALPAKSDLRNFALDRQSNVFAIDGKAGIIKYNSEGEEQYRLVVPLEDDQHEIREILADDFNSFYVAVGTGGRSMGAKIVKYRERLFEGDDDSATCKKPTPPRASIDWTITTDAFVGGMVLREGRLYTVQNRPRDNAADVVIYDNIDTLNPEEVTRRPFAFPATGIAVKANGDFFACADDNTIRGRVPNAPNFTAKSVDWQPEDLDGWDEVVWSWHDSADRTTIVTREGVDVAEDGDEVVAWLDKSGNRRHVTINDTDPGPAYRESGIGGLPCLRFDGTNVLVSEIAYGNDTNRRDQQLCLFPGYGSATGSSSYFCAFIVLRGRQRPDPAATTDYQVPIAQLRAGAGGTDLAVVMNRAAGATATASSPSLGDLVWMEDNSTAAAASGPVEGSFDNNVQTVILTIYMGNSNQATPGTIVSAFRVNGTTTEEYDSDNSLANENYVTVLGKHTTTANTEFFGEIAEIIVVDLFRAAERSVIFNRPTGTGTASVSTFGTATVVERVEGYLAHKWGLAHLLQAPAAGSVEGHPYYLDAGAPTENAPWNKSPESRLNSIYALLARFGGEKANPRWVLTSEGIWDGSFTAGVPVLREFEVGGVGYACAVTCDDNVYSVGRTSTFTAAGTALIDEADVSVRKVIDAPNTTGPYAEQFSVQTAQGAWTYILPDNGVSATEEFEDPNIYLDVDEFDNLWVPYYDTDAATHKGLIAFDSTGAVIVNVELATDQDFFAAHTVTNDVPDYEDGSGITRHEFVYVGGEAVTDATTTLLKLRVVSATPSAGAVREVRNLAVEAGNITKFDSTGPTVPTGGTGALSAVSQYIDSTVLFGDVFFTDGAGYQVYKSKTDEVVEYTSMKGGQLPKRAKLIANWRGRIVLARTADNPHDWHMSKSGDPYDWDQFPPVVVADQAVSADRGNQRAGRVPDVINALVPYNDDLLLFGGDHTIWRLTGDPMAGGQIDLVSDVTGMAFGRSWTKDPDGIVYFFGSRGGVYAMPPAGMPKRISLHRLERTLQSFDLATYHVELFWNYRDEGLHVLQMPYATGQAQPRHFFWEKKTNAWWEDSLGASLVSAAMVLDGDDPTDRVVLLGGEDGYVRKWDEDASDDDTAKIQSEVLIGPVHSGDQYRAVRWTRIIAMLADDQDGCRYKLYSSDTADRIGPVLREGVLGPGRNDHLPARIKAPFLWLRLFNSASGERWAMEGLSMFMSRAGRLRKGVRR